MKKMRVRYRRTERGFVFYSVYFVYTENALLSTAEEAIRRFGSQPQNVRFLPHDSVTESDIAEAIRDGRFIEG